MRAKLLRSVVVAAILMAIAGVARGAETEGAALSLLRGFEWQLDPERFAALPQGIYTELLTIAGDAEQAPYIRERAAAALALYPNGEVLQFFVERIRGEREPVLRRNLVQSFCNAFAGQAPEAVEAALADLLAARDIHLRIRVARCLRGLGTASASARVEQYRATISEPWERSALASDQPR